ncbi:protein kinase C delta type, partial [Biomphalaria glabrata]
MARPPPTKPSPRLSQTPSLVSTASVGGRRSSTGMPGTGFIRVKLLAADVTQGPDAEDPFLAVNVKEALDIPGKGVQLIQKKKTLYPKWNSCFDAHLYEGRTIQMIVMEKPNKNMGEISIGVKALADKCNGGVNSGPIW